MVHGVVAGCFSQLPDTMRQPEDNITIGISPCFKFSNRLMFYERVKGLYNLLVKWEPRSGNRETAMPTIGNYREIPTEKSKKEITQILLDVIKKAKQDSVRKSA